MRILAWLESLAVAALWGFLLCGGLGLAEGVYQWIRFDLLPGREATHDLIRLWLPPLTFCGWAGSGATVVFFLLGAIVGFPRGWPRGRIFTFAVGTFQEGLGRRQSRPAF